MGRRADGVAVTSHIRKTSEGVLITENGLKWAYAACAVFVGLFAGVIGAARFVIKAQDAPTRTEFHNHVLDDSVVHREQAIHSAFQDSILSRAVRDNHTTSCFVAHYPQPMCADVPTAGNR
jgi:hypothetical protein